MKLIIIDDEIKICHLIKKLIDFEKLDIELIDMYHNGITGLKAIKEKKPDIVITDIKMPGLDGISLIKESKDLDIDFIIISGHRQFEYAHTAIKYGVENYLLKPISEEELNATLSKIKKKNTNKKIENNYLIDKLFNKNNDIKFNYLENHSFSIVCIKTLFNTKELNDNLLKIIKEKIIGLTESNLSKLARNLEYYFNSSYSYILLYYNYNNKEKVNNSISNLLFELKAFKFQFFNKLNFSIGLTKSFKFLDYKHLYLAKNKSNEYLNKNEFSIFLDSKENVNYYCDLYNFSNICYKAIVNNDANLLTKEIEYIKDNNKKLPGYKTFELIKDLLSQFYLKINIFKHYDSIWIDKSLNLIELSSSIEYVYESLQTILINEINLLNNTNTNEKNTYEMAIKYIDKHFFEQSISLETIAKQINITPSYLSSLFKKNNDVGFLNFITEKRVLLAKEMLRKSNKKIKEIAVEVGYSDVKYFTKIFKKSTSLKPSEYRKLYG